MSRRGYTFALAVKGLPLRTLLVLRNCSAGSWIRCRAQTLRVRHKLHGSQLDRFWRDVFCWLLCQRVADYRFRRAEVKAL
jgi:hypothetical protein